MPWRCSYGIVQVCDRPGIGRTFFLVKPLRYRHASHATGLGPWRSQIGFAVLPDVRAASGALLGPPVPTPKSAPANVALVEKTTCPVQRADSNGRDVRDLNDCWLLGSAGMRVSIALIVGTRECWADLMPCQFCQDGTQTDNLCPQFLHHVTQGKKISPALRIHNHLPATSHRDMPQRVHDGRLNRSPST